MLVILLLFGGPVFAQIDTGSILGTVSDQTGAVIPGAKVSITNEGTSLTLSVVTGPDGSYVFMPIKIGQYTVSAEYQGFAKTQRQHVTVDVQQQVVVNFTMNPGQTTQTINVTGEVSQLQTQEASVGQVVESKILNDLPLNGRNYTFLAQLSAGVTKPQLDSRGEELSGSFSANGQRPSQNNYVLDGIDNNSNEVDFLNGTAYVVRPPIDAIQEFKLQTSNYSAELGRSAGAVVNATIKSGTNQLHGAAWEFVRNDKVDAANFFTNAAGQKKGEYRLNQFGFAVGGPIVVPHVYDGKRKTFFFGDFEGTRIRQAQTWVGTVPTALERNSGYTNFSELTTYQSGTQTDILGRAFPLGTILDPATTRSLTAGQADPITGLTATKSGYARDPFQGNIIPANRLDQNAIKLLNLYPMPTGPGIANNYTTAPVLQDNVNQFDIRLDHNFSDRDQMFGRVSWSHEPKLSPSPLPGYADSGAFGINGQYNTTAVDIALSETHSFSSSLINEVRMGYSWMRSTLFQPNADIPGIPAQFGIQGIPVYPQDGGLPTFYITGLSNLGASPYMPNYRVSVSPVADDNLTKIHGAHSLKAGFQYMGIRQPNTATSATRGGFYFRGDYTEVPTITGGNTGIAQMLLTPLPSTVGGVGYVGGIDETVASNYGRVDMHRRYYGAYFQDDWKVTPKFTMNLGLRYEFFGVLTDKYGAQANFIQAAAGGQSQFLIDTRRQNEVLSPSFPQLLAKDGITLGYSSVPGITDTPTKSFGPRLGLAYQLTHKLVARAAYGIFYDGFENVGGAGDRYNYPFVYSFTYNFPDPGHPLAYPNGAYATLENGLAPISISATSVNATGIQLYGTQLGLKNPMIQEFNLTLQYQISPNQTFQLGYIGSTTSHLFANTAQNALSEILPPSLNAQNYVPFPDFSRSSNFLSTASNSYYNSLQATFERRFSQGLNFLADYTYARCRYDGRDELNGDIGGYRAPWLPGFGIQADYANCDFDVRQVAHISGGYVLPFGKGRRFLDNRGGVVNQTLGGWQVNWLLTEEDGQPITIPCTITTAAGLGCDALLVPGQSVIAGPHNVNHWMNPAAFANPPVATAISTNNYAVLGGTPTQVAGPGFHRMDFSLFKKFRTSDKTQLEFRGEVFNLTNTPQFANPGFAYQNTPAAPGSTTFTNTTNFGKITNTRDAGNDPREIQLALKFYW
jgi:hypothetical protein